MKIPLLSLIAVFCISISVMIWTSTLILLYYDGITAKNDVEEVESISFLESSNKSSFDTSCDHYSCFHIYKCNRRTDYRLRVYIHPTYTMVARKNDIIYSVNNISHEYASILQAVRKSRFFEADPNMACLSLPGVDTLNLATSTSGVLAGILSQIPKWNGGENHILFVMNRNYHHTINSVFASGKSILAVAGNGIDLHRRKFDVSIPAFNPFALGRSPRLNEERFILVAFLQTAISPRYAEFLNTISNAVTDANDFQTFTACNRTNYSIRCDKRGQQHRYWTLLNNSIFCLVLDIYANGQMILSDAVQFQCIPIILCDYCVLPFSEVLDWKNAAILIRSNDISNVLSIAKNISPTRIIEMRSILSFFHKSYFETPAKIALTTLQIINDRIFQHRAWSWHRWNLPDGGKSERDFYAFNFARIVPNEGFTAVVLNSNELLQTDAIKLIKRLCKSDLIKMLILVSSKIMNSSVCPFSVQFIHVQPALTSMRMLPMNIIKTESVLSIDVDSRNVGLRIEDIEFGYQTWREFSNHLVGFHTIPYFDETIGSNISMLSTSAIFYHQFYAHLFHDKLSRELLGLIAKFDICQDIAINIMTSSLSMKTPIVIKTVEYVEGKNCTNGPPSSSNRGDKLLSECIKSVFEVFQNVTLQGADYVVVPIVS